MSNRTALILALIIVASIVTDLMVNQGTASMFMAKKIMDLIEYVAFWR
ncbi:MAG: hypothetical protein ACWA40_08390 [Planktomarina sp.]